MPRYDSDGPGGPPAPGKAGEKWVPGEFLVSVRDLRLVRALLEDTIRLSFVDFDPTKETHVDEAGFQRPPK